MRKRRGLLLGLSTVLAAVACPAASSAQLFVAAPEAAPEAIDHVELAYALGAGPPATWLSIRAVRGPLAIVGALPAGARVGTGLDAWLSALETSGSVGVLPPSAEARCIAGSPVARVTWSRNRGVAPSELLLTSADDVSGALEALGLQSPRPLPEAESYVVWSFPEPEGERTTRTLRIEGAALALVPRGQYPVLVSALTRGSQAYPDEQRPTDLELTFTPGKRADSDYRDQLRDWLTRGRAPFLELRARGPLFDWSIYEDAFSTPPLVRTYAERAASELGEGDAQACSRQLTSFRQQTEPDVSACGNALDAALALRAVGAEDGTLQRFAMDSRHGVEPSLFSAGGYVASPWLRASTLAGGGCETPPLPPIGPEPPSPGTGRPAPVTEDVVSVGDDYDEDVDVEVGCWGDTSTTTSYYEDDPDDADCSSDTSSSQSSGEADCASDTSGSQAESEADCSSDTSGSQDDDAEEIDCGSDTSSTSDEADTGCGSDTSSTSDESSGYDGETCTGSAAPTAERVGQTRAHLESTAPNARKRGKRVKTSLWSVGFAALVLPIRRRKRGATRVG